MMDTPIVIKIKEEIVGEEFFSGTTSTNTLKPSQLNLHHINIASNSNMSNFMNTGNFPIAETDNSPNLILPSSESLEPPIYQGTKSKDTKGPCVISNVFSLNSIAPSSSTYQKTAKSILPSKRKSSESANGAHQELPVVKVSLKKNCSQVTLVKGTAIKNIKPGKYPNSNSKSECVRTSHFVDSNKNTTFGKSLLSKKLLSKNAKNGMSLFELGILKKTNIISSYNAPAYEPVMVSGVPLIKTNFKCNACGDSFLFESSFQSHINRHSISLTYHCKYCKGYTARHFYNKCAFWSHLLEHVISTNTGAEDLSVLHNVSVNLVSLKQVLPPFSTENADEVDKYILKNRLKTIDCQTDSLGTGGDEEQSGSDNRIHNQAKSDQYGTCASDGKTTEKTQKVNKDGDVHTSKSPLLDVTESNERGDSNRILQFVETLTKLKIKAPLCGVPGIVWNCPECFKQIATKEQLALHISRDEVPKLHCKIDSCSACFSNHCAFNAHFRTHDYTPPYVCPECGRQLLSLDLFKRHLKTKCFHSYRIEWFPCLECVGVGFTSMEMLKTHFRNIHTILFYRCSHCPVAFTSWNGITKHVVEIHPSAKYNVGSVARNVYKCNICDTCFISLKICELHLHTHLKRCVKGSKTMYRCHVCYEKVSSVSEMAKHLSKHHSARHPSSLSMCDYCGLLDDDKHELTHHKDIRTCFSALFVKNLVQTTLPHNSIYRVPRAATPNRKLSINGRAKAASTITTSSSVETMCNKEVTCSGANQVNNAEQNMLKDSKMMDSLGNLAIYSQLNSLEALEKELKQEVIDVAQQIRKVLYPCTICHVMFDCEDELSKHVCTSYYSCHMCNERFTTFNERESHVELCPSNKPMETSSTGSGIEVMKMSLNYYNCRICKIVFTEKDRYSEHLRSEHGYHMESQFSCLLCGLSYDSEEKLKLHRKQEHEAHKELPYFCIICQEQNVEKFYKFRVHLITHLNKIHKMNRACNKERMAQLLDEVNKMDLLAEGSPNFSNVPENSNDDKKNFKRKSLDSGKDLPSIKRVRIDGDGAFYCSKCQYCSEDSKDFVDHIKKHKIDNDSYQCSECGICFSVIPSLKLHLTLVHKIRDCGKYVHGLESLLCPNLYDSALYNRLALSKRKVSPRKNLISLSDHRNIDIFDSLECKVCYKTFVDIPAIRSHMRTHGMAFIQSKRCQMI